MLYLEYNCEWHEKVMYELNLPLSPIYSGSVTVWQLLTSIIAREKK